MFRFKQFTVQDDRCAMKVGTDGVLLGAWVAQSLPDLIHEQDKEVFRGDDTAVPNSCAFRVLDIGTGSGLIALMLAQKLSESPEASIFAIDIDSDAVAQAAENFAASPWSSILHAHHSSLQDWTTHTPPMQGEPEGVSLIVSNPPYFVDSLKNPDLARQTARHTDTLSYDELISCSARLLIPGGHLALILPIESESTIIALAQSHHLYPIRLCRVHGSARKPAKRVMILFHKPTESSELSVTMDWSVSPELSETLYLSESPLAHSEADKERGWGKGASARSTAYAKLCKDYYL